MVCLCNSVCLCAAQPEVKLFALTGSPADTSRLQQQQQRTGRATNAQQGQQQQQPASQVSALAPVLTLRGADQLSKAPTTATWAPGPLLMGNSSNDTLAAHNSSTSSGDSRGCVIEQARASENPAVGVCDTVGLLVSWPNHLVLFTWHVPHTGDLLLLVGCGGRGGGLKAQMLLRQSE